MKPAIYYTLGALLIISLSFCTTPRENMPSAHRGGKSVIVDTITPRVVAVSFQKDLAGKWNVISMRRQQKAGLETLSNVTLTFPETGTQFSGKAPCNSINGTIQLNGYSIRFHNIASTRMACENLEQESAYINLLQTRISAFTITGNTLYLRDGISNIVFECERAG